MAINSRAKGSRSERAVIKILKQHFPNNSFERRSLGIQGADVITDDGFPYAVEVKDQKGVRAIHLFIGHHLLRAWWKQTREQAGKVEKKPLLIAKVDRVWFATRTGDYWLLFDKWCEDNAYEHTVIS